MKIKHYLLLFCSAILLSNCNDNDNDPAPAPTPLPEALAIDGGWYLRNVSGSIAGISHDFIEGEIVWNFDATTQTVTIVNQNTNPDRADFFDSGTYSYSFITNPVTPESCLMNLKIDNLNLGCYNIGFEQMQLNNVEADGYQLNFERDLHTINNSQ